MDEIVATYILSCIIYSKILKIAYRNNRNYQNNIFDLKKILILYIYLFIKL